MEDYLYLKRLCKNILSNKFNDRKYLGKKYYYGKEIQTTPLHCSYGLIGFSVIVYGEEQYKVNYDWERDDLLINGKPYKDFINLSYLSDNDINVASDEPIWEESPRSIELESYTNAGEDMIIDLEEPTKAKLQDYINGFDINHNVSIWWVNGLPGNGVPFSNMKEHYEDYEDYLSWLQKVCDKMPY